MDALVGIGAAVGTAVIAAAGALVWKSRSKPEAPKSVALDPAVASRVNAAYGEWLFRLQGKCPWCTDGMIRSVDRTMKLNVADGSLTKNVATRCSRCRWRVDADAEALAPALLAPAPDVLAGPVVRWNVLTVSGSPIAEVTAGGGNGVQVVPSPEAAQSNDPRIALSTLLFRAACAVPLATLATEEARLTRGAAVQSRIVRAQVEGIRSVPKSPESLPPPPG